MPKAFFVDTSRCTACRGCQIACKVWHNHGVVPTKQKGSHQNPPELTPVNYKIVHFQEHMIDNKVQWLFFPEQCRHCTAAPCKDIADTYVEGAIVIDEPTGAVIYTELTKKLTAKQAQEVREFCPYDIPRRDAKSGLLTKCDMCIDRLQAGMVPSCVKTCCTGTMNFGEREAMIKLAEERLAIVKKEFPKAELLDTDNVAVIYLVTEARDKYAKHAANDKTDMLTRKELLAKVVKPVRRIFG